MDTVAIRHDTIDSQHAQIHLDNLEHLEHLEHLEQK